MNKLRKYIVVFLVQCLCIVAAFSQDAMRINGMQIVKKGETMTIDAGRVVEFEAGATLIVEGSLVVRGTSDKPVVLKSVDPQHPGNGIMVSGIDENGLIVMDNVRSNGLIQPLRFDPFWYRKSVDLKSIVFSGSTSGEPIIYVAGPLLDLREGMDIKFSMNSLKFYNNSGSVLLEKVGSDGIVYEIDKLLFSENSLPGSDATMGVLHLDVARSVTEGQLKVGELAFNRNFSGDKMVGLSMSGGNGTGSEKFLAQGVFGNDNVAELIYDRRANVRIPSLEVKKMAGLDKYSDEKNFIVNSIHTFGKVQLKVVGNPTVVKLEDSLGKPVYNNAIRKGDTLELNYLEGNPTVVTLSNGEKFMVPKLTIAQLPPPIYRRVDTTLISPVWPDTTNTLNGTDNSVKIAFSIPTFGKSGDVTRLGFWELGAYFGGAIYGGGDIPHAYFPYPSTIEYSAGTFAQYNATDRFAIKFSYSKFSISMHNIWAPGLFSRAGEVMGKDTNGNTIVYSKGFSNMFVTEMNSFDFEMLWHLKSYKLDSKSKHKIVPTLGFGFGMLSYDPYRILLKAQRKDESYPDYVDRLNANYKFSLRDMGTEGQNFLPGSKPYGKYAASVNASFGLTYVLKRWCIKGDIKMVYTSTDYLDDMGAGAWYGGDFDKWQSTIESNAIYTQDGANIGKLSANYNKSADPLALRSTNGINDGYLQMHLGISYYLSNGKKKK